MEALYAELERDKSTLGSVASLGGSAELPRSAELSLLARADADATVWRCVARAVELAGAALRSGVERLQPKLAQSSNSQARCARQPARPRLTDRPSIELHHTRTDS